MSTGVWVTVLLGALGVGCAYVWILGASERRFEKEKREKIEKALAEGEVIHF